MSGDARGEGPEQSEPGGERQPAGEDRLRDGVGWRIVPDGGARVGRPGEEPLAPQQVVDGRHQRVRCWRAVERSVQGLSRLAVVVSVV